MPKFAELLKEEFKGVDIDSGANTMNVVSLGASMYALDYYLNRPVEINEVVAREIKAKHMIDKKQFTLNTLIETQTSLPLNGFKVPFIVSNTKAYIELYEENRSLGTFTIYVPRKYVNTMQEFNIDISVDGIINVTVVIDGKTFESQLSIVPKAKDEDEIKKCCQLIDKYFKM